MIRRVTAPGFCKAYKRTRVEKQGTTNYCNVFGCVENKSLTASETAEVTGISGASVYDDR
jgi:hypothetical protein